MKNLAAIGDQLGKEIGEVVRGQMVKEIERIKADLGQQLREVTAQVIQLASLIKEAPPAPPVIKACLILEDGTLQIEMSDGTTMNAGKAQGPKGDKGDPGQDAKGEKGDKGDDGSDGVGIQDAVLEEGVLTLSLTNGQTKTVGTIVGPKGDKGDPGQDAKGEKGDKGNDGAGVVDALLDHQGQLTLTFSDGRVKALGRVIGTDGKDGEDGKPGTDGEKGADGLGLEDLDIEMVDERHFKVFAKRGELLVEKTLRVPAMIYREVYREGEAYEPGDVVTFGGCMYVALKDTTAKPNDGDAWKMAVKKGRDGRDFEVRETKKEVKL